MSDLVDYNMVDIYNTSEDQVQVGIDDGTISATGNVNYNDDVLQSMPSMTAEKLTAYAKISGVSLIPLTIIFIIIAGVFYGVKKDTIFDAYFRDALFWLSMLCVGFLINFIFMLPDYQFLKTDLNKS